MKKVLRLWGDKLTTGRQERASERRSRRKVEARHRAGNYSPKFWPELMEARLPDDRLTLDDIIRDHEGEALDRAERVAADLKLEGLRRQVEDLRKKEHVASKDCPCEPQVEDYRPVEDDGQCHGITKAGNRCKKASRHGVGGRFCATHAA